ncbi:MAG TPA: BolA family protein [Tahibacter sp.]|uniref:BolA family protein n=1 Tax=Tahibacter sp. TaxID=2056211 RepID=UPI002B781D64|nr:BolA family protein [Tahibacter sp.]HSX60710.1 BolA family protein [Tahibacter sp.]
MSDRLDRIRSALASLEPVELDLVDESHKHAGHEGARDGRGHFRARIVSAQFAGRPPLARHRLVYAALGELMNTDIHAFAIDARAPNEA